MRHPTKCVGGGRRRGAPVVVIICSALLVGLPSIPLPRVVALRLSAANEIQSEPPPWIDSAEFTADHEAKDVIGSATKGRAVSKSVSAAESTRSLLDALAPEGTRAKSPHLLPPPSPMSGPVSTSPPAPAMSKLQSVQIPGSLPPPPLGGASSNYGDGTRMIPSVRANVFFPDQLRPSQVNSLVYVHRGSENPETRPSCQAIIQSHLAAAPKYLNSGLTNLMSIVLLLGNTDEQLRQTFSGQDLDRAILRSFNAAAVVWTVADHALRRSLVNCAVDQEGRTIVMKMILRGYEDAVKSLLGRLRGDVDLTRLRDIHGNNVLHLAVMSGNQMVVEFLLGRLRNETTVQLMEAVNTDKRTPVALAYHQGRTDIAERLKESWSAFSLVKAVMNQNETFKTGIGSTPMQPPPASLTAAASTPSVAPPVPPPVVTSAASPQPDKPPAVPISPQQDNESEELPASPRPDVANSAVTSLSGIKATPKQ